MKPTSIHCPNCSAPLDLEAGQVEVPCPYCNSLLKVVPGREELEVVRTREEMKYRERVAVQQLAMHNRLQQEEADRWRQTAARVAISAVPVLGRSAGQTLFNMALGRFSGCLGCGCLVPIVILGIVLLGYFAR